MTSFVQNIKVSVAVLTFNHEKFIAQAIDSILMQNVSFDYEIVIHDDASSDSTVAIIKQYQLQYPDKIKLILQHENQYSQSKALYDLVLPSCTGEYIAICEGDDYWGDENKLAIQAQYLDEHPTVFISGHDAKIIDENNQVKSHSKLPKQYQRDFSALDMQKGLAWLLTGTWLFRNKPFPKALERGRVINGDAFLLILLGQFGGSHHHADIKPAYYRVHSQGVWSSRSKKQQQLATLNTFYWAYHYYGRVQNVALATHFEAKFFSLSLRYASFILVLKELLTRLTLIRLTKALWAKVKRFF
jgi:glycosyltransferase involved in cell wall biosynthesis